MSLSGKAIASSRNNPCPICENIKGDCRILPDDTVFCHSFVDTRKGEKVNGYVCVKEENGHTATFKPDNSAEWSEERRLEWENLKKSRQVEAQKEHEKLAASSLNADDRHKWYSGILSELVLDKRTREELEQRGLTDDEIASCGFRSVSRYHKLKTKVTNKLPGISEDGQKLLVADDGYLCPIQDWQGRIVACQVRILGATDNKYRWLSTKEVPAKLYPEGELPLAVFKPTGKPKGIALVEGVGAKPYLSSRRLNQIIIGSPGGLFASSPKLLEQYLNLAHQELGGEKILTIYPDAGDVGNESVVKRWEKVADLLDSLGWECRFAWWSQLKKSDSDIDELENYENIQFINPKEFFNIAELQCKLARKAKRDKEKEEEDRELFKILSEAKYALSSITEKPYVRVNVAHLGETIAQYVKPGAIYFIISDPGTGKTEGTSPLVEKSSDVYSWHARNSLAKERASSVPGFIHRENIESGKKSDHRKVCFCSPSSPQFDARNLNNANALLESDEFDQVADFNFGDPCNNDGSRPLILATLEAHVKAIVAGKGTATFMSADLAQKEIDYTKELAPPGTEIRVIINDFRRERPVIQVDESEDPFELAQHLVETLRTNIPCFVLDDMKDGIRGSKTLAHYILSEVPELEDLILEVNRDTQNDERVVKFFENPNEESKKYLAIICSPSVISGISLKNGKFNKGVFGFCNGVLIDKEIKQFINRVRGAENIYLWVSESGFLPKRLSSDDYTPERVNDFYQRNYKKNSKHILSFRSEYQPITDSWTSPHWRLYCKNQAYRVACMQFLRKFTIQHLEESGYTIEKVNLCPEGGTKQIEDRLKNIWAKIEVDGALAIQESRFLSQDEMNLVENAFRAQESVSRELELGYLKTKLRENFGEELVESMQLTHKGTDLKDYAAMAIKNKKNHYLNQLENFYLLTKPLEESAEKDFAVEFRQMKMGSVFPADTRWNASKRSAREEIGLINFLDPETWWEPKDYTPMCEMLKKYSRGAKDRFGFSVEDISSGQIFVKLLEQLGLRLDSKEVKFPKENGKRGKYYEKKIKQEDWDRAQMFCRYKEEQKAKKEAEKAAREEAWLNEPHNLATEISKVRAKEDYEALVQKVQRENLDKAFKMVSSVVQKKINDFYKKEEEPAAIQLSLIKEVKPVALVNTLETEQQKIDPCALSAASKQENIAVFDPSKFELNLTDRIIKYWNNPDKLSQIISNEHPAEVEQSIKGFTPEQQSWVRGFYKVEEVLLGEIQSPLEVAYLMDTAVEENRDKNYIQNILFLSNYRIEDVSEFLSPEALKLALAS
jgi:hypothetical protein